MTLDATTATTPTEPGVIVIDGVRYLTDIRLAAVLGITRRSLQRWDELRQAPPKITIVRKVLYRESAVRKWLAIPEQIRQSRPQTASWPAGHRRGLVMTANAIHRDCIKQPKFCSTGGEL
ncbi:MAG: hypothetical protein GC191_21030 [Azospirillum sp.]|nr:hypothetical protein [Azospirillum sp.]